MMKSQQSVPSGGMMTTMGMPMGCSMPFCSNQPFYPQPQQMQTLPTTSDCNQCCDDQDPNDPCRPCKCKNRRRRPLPVVPPLPILPPTPPVIKLPSQQMPPIIIQQPPVKPSSPVVIPSGMAPVSGQPAAPMMSPPIIIRKKKRRKVKKKIVYVGQPPPPPPPVMMQPPPPPTVVMPPPVIASPPAPQPPPVAIAQAAPPVVVPPPPPPIAAAPIQTPLLSGILRKKKKRKRKRKHHPKIKILQGFVSGGARGTMDDGEGSRMNEGEIHVRSDSPSKQENGGVKELIKKITHKALVAGANLTDGLEEKLTDVLADAIAKGRSNFKTESQRNHIELPEHVFLSNIRMQLKRKANLITARDTSIQSKNTKAVKKGGFESRSMKKTVQAKSHGIKPLEVVKYQNSNKNINKHNGYNKIIQSNALKYGTIPGSNKHHLNLLLYQSNEPSRRSIIPKLTVRTFNENVNPSKLKQNSRRTSYRHSNRSKSVRDRKTKIRTRVKHNRNSRNNGFIK